VDASRALAASGITLRYPSYKDGISPTATGYLQASKRIVEK
jgi:hypothetical protein